MFQFDLGSTVITDFQDGADKLALDSVVSTWRDLILTQEGADTRISYFDSSVLLLGVDVSDLSGRDFLINAGLTDAAGIRFMTGWDYLV